MPVCLHFVILNFSIYDNIFLLNNLKEIIAFIFFFFLIFQITEQEFFSVPGKKIYRHTDSDST